MTTVSILCAIIAFIGFGVMDELAHHYDSITVTWIRNNPQFWDKRKSWENKYTPVDYDMVTVYEEKFWGSSRWFVFLTDGWHLVQFISYHMLSTALAFAYCNQLWVALLLSLPVHVVLSTVKSLTMKVV